MQLLARESLRRAPAMSWFPCYTSPAIFLHAYRRSHPRHEIKELPTKFFIPPRGSLFRMSPSITSSINSSFRLLLFAEASGKNYPRAVFSAGCFWDIEYLFKNLEGVLWTRVGYTGGTMKKPSYEWVCTNSTGHTLAVEVTFDPQKLSYEDLIRFFFEIHDPCQINRLGGQYRSVIFYNTKDQKQTADKVLKELREEGMTQVVEEADFWPAEDYHQQYLMRIKDYPACHFRIPRTSSKLKQL